MNAKKNGFTLVELMVVVVIIGILASLAIPRFLAVTARSKATEFRMIFKQLYNLENVYQHENDHYTGVFAELGMDEIPPGARFSYAADAGVTTYIGIATLNPTRIGTYLGSATIAESGVGGVNGSLAEISLWKGIGN